MVGSWSETGNPNVIWDLKMGLSGFDNPKFDGNQDY
jgi:hypothetical protein